MVILTQRLKKHIVPLVLLTVILFGLLLRLFNIHDNIFFAYDQARDAQRMVEMSRGDLKLVGPETDIPGVFHGVLFYYLIFPIYSIFNFDPNAVSLFFVLVDLAGVVLIYYTGSRIGRSKTVGLLSSFLWAVSFQQMSFARFISNVSLLPLSSVLFFTGSYLFFVEKKQWAVLLSMLGLGLSIQSNMVSLFFIPLFFCMVFVFKPKTSKQNIFISFLILLFFLFPFILAEIKHQFLGVQSLFLFFQNSPHTPTTPLSGIATYAARLNDSIGHHFFALPEWLGILIFAAICIFVFTKSKNKKNIFFLFIWAFSILPLFMFSSGILNSPTINSITVGGMCIIMAVFIEMLYYQFQKKYIIPFLILILIFFNNFILLRKDNFIPIRLFAYQNITLSDVKKVVSYTYKKTQGQPFGICSVSNPLFINTLWSFAYLYLKPSSDASIPLWTGQRQNLNINYLPYLSKNDKIDTLFLIIEPQGGIPSYAKTAAVFLLDQETTVAEEKKFGEFVVQKRSINLIPNEAEMIPVPDNLKTILSKEPRFNCYVKE